MFQRILLCTDGSDQALDAAKTAAELAQKFGSKVTILNVMSPSVVAPAVVGGMEPMAYVEVNPNFIEEAQEAVERRTGRILEEKNVSYECRREIGHPVDRIVSVAEAEQSDLVVMGSRGLGGFSRFLLGSVSDGVLHHAPCPVLIIR